MVCVLIASSFIEIFFFCDHDIITFLPYTIYMYNRGLLFVAIFPWILETEIKHIYYLFIFFFLQIFLIRKTMIKGILKN